MVKDLLLRIFREHDGRKDKRILQDVLVCYLVGNIGLREILRFSCQRYMFVEFGTSLSLLLYGRTKRELLKEFHWQILLGIGGSASLVP